MTEQEKNQASPTQNEGYEQTPNPSINCPTCGQFDRQAEQFIYSLGKLDLQFPTIGVEREFKHREQLMPPPKKRIMENRGKRIVRVLEENHHLARNVCYTLTIGGIQTYILMPTSAATLNSLLEAIESLSESDSWNLVIGQRIGNSSPTTCGGLMAPIVACDQIYTFSLKEWSAALYDVAKPALETGDTKAEEFETLARELFERVAHSAENIGGLDTHRALNYVLMQHPGFFVAVAERAKTSVLDRIETRPVQGGELRILVAVILTFVDRRTAVPERLFCTVDVTERWPFLAETYQGTTGPLAMLPFVENSVLGMTI